MPETGFSKSPKIQKGALVQLVEGPIAPLPNIVPFQYNPQTLRRTMKPWDPMQVDETQRGQLAPTAQPFDPEETISLEIELDATDQLEDDDVIATTVGVADRIAAIEKMLLPGDSPLGQLLAAVGSLIGAPIPPKRDTVAVTFLIWGIGRAVPVRITSYSIEEQLFLPSLYPVQAKINLSAAVLTPDRFRCMETIGSKFAVAAYEFFRLQQDALAIAHTARNVELARSLLPL